jgi:hypothetical protein
MKLVHPSLCHSSFRVNKLLTASSGLDTSVGGSRRLGDSIKSIEYDILLLVYFIFDTHLITALRNVNCKRVL